MESVFDPLMPLYALVHYYGMVLMGDMGPECTKCWTRGGNDCGSVCGSGNNQQGSQPSQPRGTSWNFNGNSEWDASFTSDAVTDWDKIFTDVVLTLVTVTLIAGLVAVAVIVYQDSKN